MEQKRMRYRPGLTIIELAVAAMAAVMLTLVIGVVLVADQRSWNSLYDCVNGDVATDAYRTRRAFDAVVRRSSAQRELISEGNITLYSYADPDTSTYLDRYARFYSVNEQLLVDYGDVDASGNVVGAPATQTLGRNVEGVRFAVQGTAVQMVLVMNDGARSVTIMTSALRHNE